MSPISKDLWEVLQHLTEVLCVSQYEQIQQQYNQQQHYHEKPEERHHYFHFLVDKIEEELIL